MTLVKLLKIWVNNQSLHIARSPPEQAQRLAPLGLSFFEDLTGYAQRFHNFL
jgi:hypothetical protein